MLIILRSWGCDCGLKGDFKSKADLAEYDFIALVRISNVDSAEVKAQPGDLIHLIKFEVLEKYKGETINNILVSGGHKSLKTWTSCDLSEDVNEEWVIFGYFDKRTNTLMTGMCTRTFMYKDALGYRYKGYGNELASLDKLRDIFEIGVEKPRYNGKRVEYYPSGQKELEEYYSRSKLNGERLLWYPNGELEARQFFKKGELDGIAERYSKMGQLLTKEKFKSGHHIDTTIHWHEVDTSLFQVKLYSLFKMLSADSARKVLSSIKISSKHIYDSRGELIYYCNYSRTGRLQSETIIEAKKDKQTHKSYHDNGTIQSEMYRVHNLDFGVYREWEKTGELTKSWEYDSNGKQIKESIKIYKK